MKAQLTALFCALVFTLTAQAPAPAKTYELRNGNFYNGKDFTTGTWYVVNGTFTKKAPAKIDSVVELDGRWITPPLGDAFCGSVADNPSGANLLNLYREEGVFYLQMLGHTQEGRKSAELLTGKSNMPDATYSNGAITCSLGYPFLQYEGPAQGIKNPQQWGTNFDKIKTERKMFGNGYWFVDNKTALDANWPKILAQKPDVIYISLLDVSNAGGSSGKGLTAEMAKAVIKKAHKSKLRVFAFVEKNDDLRIGLKAGVDGFANLPGHNWNGEGDLRALELSDADIKMLAKKKTVIIPLLAHAQTAVPRPAVQEFHKKTLERLLDANANVVIGSDDLQRTIRTELNYWFNLKAGTSEQFLRVLCDNTPRAIYPKRKIGKIEEGYEASFLALSDNPMQNILKLRVIAFKMKKGVMLK